MTVPLPPEVRQTPSTAKHLPVARLILPENDEVAVPVTANAVVVAEPNNPLVEETVEAMTVEIVPVVALRVVNVPAAAVLPPMIIPSSVPPVRATLLAFCVEIVPRPRLFLAVEVLVRSERLLATRSAPLSEVMYPELLVN